MSELHPNVALLSALDLRDLDASAKLFSDDFVWHYFNPNLPELEGDFAGLEGLKRFFRTLATNTKSTFKVEPISATPFGNEFVVTHVRDTMEHEGNPISLDAVVVWRIVGGKLAEAWDIPATHNVVTLSGGNSSET